MQQPHSPIFAKRHYNILAKFAAQNLFDYQTYALASVLQADNPTFNTARFVEAVEEAATQGAS